MTEELTISFQLPEPAPNVLAEPLDPSRLVGLPLIDRSVDPAETVGRIIHAERDSHGLIQVRASVANESMAAMALHKVWPGVHVRGVARS